jgi:DNA replication protein DnaC
MDNLNIEIFNPKNLALINCAIHGDNVKSLMNGTCQLCYYDKKQEETNKEVNKIKNLLIKESNIKAFYANAEFENYVITNDKQKQIIEELNQYNGNTNVLLLGKTGTGKTHLGCSIIKNYIKNYYDIDINNLNSFKNITKSPCYYIKYYNLTALKINDYKKFNEIISSKILVIDEVANMITDYKLGLLFEIIDQRYDDNLKTVLISNLSTEEFKKILPNPIYSRLKESYQVYNFTWDDYRLNKNSSIAL